MAYPQGFLFQPSVSLALHSCPSFSSGVILGPRTEELGRSSSGSAFAPYSGSATSPGFNSPLPYGGEPRVAATLSSFMSPAYDPSSGSLDYHPFGALGPYPYGDPAYRKNATRDATATLKAWLQEHRKNPYPTKGEKIMLAIITKMTLTQVSTWFANARRRLKKENKMTWTPRNRSEDEEEDENIDLERNDEDEEQMKMNNEIKKSNETKDEAALRSASEVNVCKLIVREDATNMDFKDCGDRRSSRSTGAPCQSVLESDCRVSREHSDSDQRPTVAPKPKLWSLAEIAMSSDRNRSCSDSSQSPVSPPTSTPRTPFSHGSALPRHLYYTTPFIPGYSSFDPLGPQHGGPGSFKRITSDSAAVTSARDCRRSQSQLEQHELQRGTANV